MRVDVSYHFKPNPEADTQIANSNGVQTFTAVQARLLMYHARREFLRQVKHTHPVTPPPYSESFYMKKAPSLGPKRAGGYIVGNSDPAAILVEFGAHPRGGPTFVLGYRPLGKALDLMED